MSGGLIYFVRVKPDGPIKIGVTGDTTPETRIVGIQVGCPWEIELIGSVPGEWSDEQRLHQRLSAYRLRGEWFSPHEKVLEAIAHVLKDGFPPPAAPLHLPNIEPDPRVLEEFRDRARGLVGAIHLHLPPDLSVRVRRAAACAEVTVEDLITDVLRDVFHAGVSRETPASEVPPNLGRAGSPARSLLG